MGLAFSWIAVRDMSAEELFEELELESTNEGHATPPLGYSCYERIDDDELVVVVAFGRDECTDLSLELAQKISLAESSYFYSQYDVANYSELAYCHNGEIVWQIDYHAGSEHGLRSRGVLPESVASQIAVARTELAEDDIGALQNIAECVAESLTGFSLHAHMGWDTEEEYQRAIDKGPFVELLVVDA